MNTFVWVISRSGLRSIKPWFTHDRKMLRLLTDGTIWQWVLVRPMGSGDDSQLVLPHIPSFWASMSCLAHMFMFISAGRQGTKRRKRGQGRKRWRCKYFTAYVCIQEAPMMEVLCILCVTGGSRPRRALLEDSLLGLWRKSLCVWVFFVTKVFLSCCRKGIWSK